MNILMLNCSPRQQGYTTTILQHIRECISQEHTIEWVDVNNLSIKPCMGCLQCRPDKECVLKEDDGHVVGRKIQAADALVIGCPTYWGNMTGPLKILFDRIVPVLEYVSIAGGSSPKPRQKGKKALIVIASSAPWPFNLLSSQSRGTIQAIKTVLNSGGYKTIGVINLPGTSAKKEIPPKLVQNAKRLGGKLMGDA